MWDLLSRPAVQALLGLAVVMIAVYFAYRVIMSLRPSDSKADMSDLDLAKDFEEMRLGGDINEEELRSIKTVIGKTQDER